MTVTQRDAAIARITGLDAFFVRHGMPSAKVRSCLADKAVLDKLAAIMERGNREGVDGTPSFFINGARNDAHDWQTLAPLLQQAVG
jgi:protein-disulfide isomerase